MVDRRTDDIAREAARMIGQGRASDIGRAIRAAADVLGAQGAPLPGHGLVRKHARGMALQAMGDRAYLESIRDVWRVAEELMTAVEEAVDGSTCLLAGRAARGNIDAGVEIHVRVYTDAPVGLIVGTLVDLGYEEPAFETASTRFGRLDRVRFVEEGREVVLTRCPADLYHRARDRERDLFRGRPIETATTAKLRRRLNDPPRIP